MGINRCIVVDNSERYAGVELPVLKGRYHFALPVRDLWHYNRISGASSRIYWPSTTCTNGTRRKMWSSNMVSRLSYTCTSLKLEILCAAYTRGSSPTSFTFNLIQITYVSQDNAVDIATSYGLDGPGIESRWGRYFPRPPDLPWGPPTLLYNGYRVF
jgi:hypothetical protein